MGDKPGKWRKHGKTWAMTAVILLVIIVFMQVVTRTPCIKSVVYARLLFVYLRAASENCC